MRRMKAVALAKGRYRPGIDQECIKKQPEGKYCMLCGASECSECACGHQAYLIWPMLS